MIVKGTAVLLAQQGFASLVVHFVLDGEVLDSIFGIKSNLAYRLSLGLLGWCSRRGR